MHSEENLLSLEAAGADDRIVALARKIVRLVLPWIIGILMLLQVACAPAPSLVAIDGVSGKVLWRAETDGRVIGAHANRVVVERESELVGLDAGTGTIAWALEREPNERAVENFGDPQFALLLGAAGTVRSVTVTTGAVAKPVEFPALEPERTRRLAVIGEVAFAQHHDGDLVQVSREAVACDVTRPDLAPVIGGGFVYFVDSNGTLAATDLATGSEVWSIAVLPPAASLEHRDDALWLGGRLGALFVVEAKNGDIRFVSSDAGTDAQLLRDPDRSVAPRLARSGQGVFIVDAKHGAVAPSIPFADRIAGGAALRDGCVVRRADDGALIGFDAAGVRRFEVAASPLNAVTAIIVDPAAPRVTLL
jgi:outer membrane protein assembly factor BamB